MNSGLSLQKVKSQLMTLCDQLLERETQIQQETQNYQNVSLIRNLDKQIVEKNNYIKVLERQLRLAKKQRNKPCMVHQLTQTDREVKENIEEEDSDEEETDEEEETDDDSSEDISVHRKIIDGTAYYIDSDTQQVYKIDEDDEIGDCIGIYRNSMIQS